MYADACAHAFSTQYVCVPLTETAVVLADAVAVVLLLLLLAASNAVTKL